MFLATAMLLAIFPVALTDAVVQIYPVPPASDCRIAPRTLDELNALAQMPRSRGEADGSLPGLPFGWAAPPEIVHDVTNTMWEAMACINAGDNLRFYALHSDRFFHGASERGLDSTSLREIANDRSTPVPDDELLVYAIWDVRVLTDGRAGALVRFGGELGGIDGQQTRYIFFLRDGARWVIDDGIDQPTLIDMGVDVTPPAGSAVAPPRPMSNPPASAASCPAGEREPAIEAVVSDGAPLPSSVLPAPDPVSGFETVTRLDLPDGPPAAGGTLEKARDTVSRLVACSNGGLSPERLFTDDYFRRVAILEEDDDSVSLEYGFPGFLEATPMPVIERSWTLLDGRVAVIILPLEMEANILVLAPDPSSGDLLIDEAAILIERRDPILPAASDCTVAPIELPLFGGTPVADVVLANPALDRTRDGNAGQRADNAVRAEITDTLFHWLACQNAGDPYRTFAFYSDGYLARFFSQPDVSRPDLFFEDLVSTNEITGIVPFVFVEIGFGTIHEDGRVSALVTIRSIDDEGSPVVEIAREMVFVHSGVRWLIDEWRMDVQEDPTS